MNLDPIRTAALVVLLALLALLGVQHYRIKSLKRENALYAQAAKSYRLAESHNLQTIGDLQKRIAALVEQQRLDAKAAAEAVAQAQADAERARQHYNDETERLERLYANSETARAWGNGAVDADVAGRLPNGTRH